MYELRGEGPDHQKRFFARVLLGGELRGEGSGGSKKQAEQGAAEAALQRLSAELGHSTDQPSVEQGAGGR